MIGLRWFVMVIVASGFIGCNDTSDEYGTRYKVSYAELEQGFHQPPGKSGIRSYWWWLNSGVTKECITKDLEAMKENGYGGAIIFDAGSSNYSVAKKTNAGPAFLSREWLELFSHAVSEADRLGLEISINVQSGWNPGGPSVTPEHAMKKITWSEMNLQGPGTITVELPVPEYQYTYKDISVLAVRNLADTLSNQTRIRNIGIKTLGQRIGWSGIYPLHLLREDYEGPENPIVNDDYFDVTANCNGGLLTWEVPEGEWTILRFGQTNTGVRVSTASDGWDGLSLDHLSREALLRFDKDVITPLVQTAKSAGDALRFIHTDSWEMGVANWTDTFQEEFIARNGYDITPYLPVLTNRIVGSREISNRFLHDFRRTVADLVADNFYRTFREIAYREGLYTHPESGGPHSAPIDAIRTMSFNDVPMGEFWVRSNTHRVEDAQRLAVKQSASVAHIYGRKFVAAEGPTSIGPHWERPPKDCKNVIDRIFCSGVNRIVWHTYTASPDEYGRPGNEYFAGTHLNRHVTWWKEAGAFIDYMNRASFMLSQGLFVADALYYYGDDTPNFVFLREEVTDLEPGYDWDKCSFDVLMDRVRIVNGRIVLPDGMSYAILVLPDYAAIRAELLIKLEELVNRGMVMVGPRPAMASGLKNFPESDRIVESISGRLWGSIDGINVTENRVGKGKVIDGITPAEVLRGMGILPDFTWESRYSDTHLDYIHRQTATEDIYFVVNRLARHGINDTRYRYHTDLPDRFEQLVCKFRVTGKSPEFWNPMTGEIHPVLTYRQEGEYTLIPMHLAPEGSLFVVFRKKKPEKHIRRIERDEISIWPEIIPETDFYPAFSAERDNDALFVTVSQTGNYILQWSDGTVSAFAVDEPVKQRPIGVQWRLKFMEPWGPGGELVFDSLMSWSDHRDENIKYYSGAAVYTNEFELSGEDIDGSKILADLGNIQEIASLRINGRDAGVSWIAPFVHDITGLVREGRNLIEITVVNSWVNRLIGDGMLPADQRFTRTNIMKFEAPGGISHIRKSGLMGEVSLVLVKKIYL
jgi:hypothetical protein